MAGISTAISSAQNNKGRERLEQTGWSPGNCELCMWLSHVTADMSLSQVRRDVICRDRERLTLPTTGIAASASGKLHTSAGHPQSHSPKCSRLHRSSAGVVHVFPEDTQMCANWTQVNVGWTLGGFQSGKGSFGNSLPAVNDLADLKINVLSSVRGMRWFTCLWWQILSSDGWCHPSLHEKTDGKALKELQKNSVSGVGVKRIQLYHAAFKATFC